MELEAVGRVPMCNVGFEVRWQVDNVYRSEWALLRADTTPNTQSLRDKRDLGIGSDFYAEPSATHHRA